MATESLTIEIFPDLLQLSDFDLTTIDLREAALGATLSLIFKQVFPSPDIYRFAVWLCESGSRQQCQPREGIAFVKIISETASNLASYNERLLSDARIEMNVLA